MPDAGPEIPRVEELVGEEEHHHDSYGRRVAIATVVTTLIAALVAFAQASSLKLHDRTDSRAEEYGALALQAAAVNRGKAEAQIDRFSLLTQQVRAADNASLFQSYGNASTATRLEAARWNAIATQTEADTAAIAHSQGIAYICAPSVESGCTATDASYSPEQDPNFPNRYMEQTHWSAYELTALRDASNQEADDAEAQFVHYAAALTMLAVAVFLFGYSLTPQGRTRRRLYSRVASGFVVVAGLWALFQALSPVSHPPDAAARAFANAEVDYRVGDYPAAIKEFNRTLKLRPRFVDAYFDRSQAEFAAGIPHIGTGADALPTTAGPATIPSLAALDAAVSDDQHARNSGSDSATVLFALGKDLLYRGVLENRRDDLRRSRDYLDEAATRFKSQEHATYLIAGSYLRIAEDDLVLGSPEADSAYATAERELSAPDVPREAAVAPSLTDLSLIETKYPRLATKADAIKQQLIATGERGASTPTGATPAASTTPVVLGGISAQPDPGHALYTISKPGKFNPAHDVLSAQWEYRDPLHGEWAVLPELSGPVTFGGLLPNGQGYASNNPSYVSNSSPATCLPPGQYRVELYVNGRLAGTGTATGGWSSLHAVRFSDVDGAICVPQGYKPFPNAQPGSNGYFGAGGSGGAFILSIPKAAAGAIANNSRALAIVMQDAVKGFSSFLPGLRSAGSSQSTPFFMSSQNGQYQQWIYAHGQVLTGVGTSSNGQIYIGIAWGPLKSGLASEMFLSLSPL